MEKNIEFYDLQFNKLWTYIKWIRFYYKDRHTKNNYNIKKIYLVEKCRIMRKKKDRNYAYGIYNDKILEQEVL